LGIIDLRSPPPIPHSLVPKDRVTSNYLRAVSLWACNPRRTPNTHTMPRTGQFPFVGTNEKHENLSSIPDTGQLLRLIFSFASANIRCICGRPLNTFQATERSSESLCWRSRHIQAPPSLRASEKASTPSVWNVSYITLSLDYGTIVPAKPDAREAVDYAIAKSLIYLYHTVLEHIAPRRL